MYESSPSQRLLAFCKTEQRVSFLRSPEDRPPGVSCSGLKTGGAQLDSRLSRPGEARRTPRAPLILLALSSGSQFITYGYGRSRVPRLVAITIPRGHVKGHDDLCHI